MSEYYYIVCVCVCVYHFFFILLSVNGHLFDKAVLISDAPPY